MAFGVDVKKRVQLRIEETIHEYEKRENIKTKFGKPIVGYVLSKNPIFNELFIRDMCLHPKGIFRPGNTVIVYFVPFEDKVAESNKGGSVVSEEWARAHKEAVMLTAKINDELVDSLNWLGRDSSLTSISTDWNEEAFSSEWVHKMVAYIAGLGTFHTGGMFQTEVGFAGRFGSIIVDLALEPSKIWTEEMLKDTGAICDDMFNQCQYKTAQNPVKPSQEKIAACPAGAISEGGVDRNLCQEFCKKQDQVVPSPDVCGKCYY